MTAAGRIAIAVAVLGALLLLLSLVPHDGAVPCRIPGHSRTAVVECGAR